MDIIKKLSYYRSPSVNRAVPDEKTIPSSLQALKDHFAGEILENQAPFLKIRRQMDINPQLYNPEIHGRSISISLLSKGERQEAIPIRECVFFDLETTGLMGGSGTLPFLLGFASVDDKQVIVEQYFLPDFGREYLLFKKLLPWLAGFKYLFSYNGKSYDWPLLKTRFVMNQINPAPERLIHVDLLHMARRLWKNKLASCDLMSVEFSILQRHRGSDIPGWMIPQSYFNFLRTGTIHDMIRIIEHNYYDLLTSVELLLLFSRIEAQPESVRDPHTLQAMAQLAFEQNNLSLLQRFYDLLSSQFGISHPQLQVWMSLLHKRKGQWNEALVFWEKLIDHAEYADFALEELAKYYEHQVKDISKALDYTQRFLRKLELKTELGYSGQEFNEIKNRFVHRQIRLISKLS